MAKKAGALVVDLPPPSADQPSWLRVGIFAIVGLGIGIAWPRIFGVRLGPSAPAPVGGAEAQSGARPNEPPPSLPASVAAQSPTAAVNAANAAAAGSSVMESSNATVDVRRGVVISCTTDTGERLKGSACGNVDFDSIALPRLKKMAHCPTADGADGKLSVLFGLDFKSSKVRVDLGRSTNIENKDTFATCLRNQFDNVSIGALAHDNDRYTVSYSLRFAPKGSVTPAPGGEQATPGTPSTSAAQTAVTPAADLGSDTAQIVWEVGIIRDAPRTGATVARLPRGTTVKLAGGEQGWYRIRYGQGFASEGWVYRGAVGK